MNKKLNIAVLFGGDSSEKYVSERSSITVAKHLPKDKYNVFRVFVGGRDWLVENGDSRIPVDKNDFGFTLDGEKTVFDCACIIIHGTPGENGLLQAYFEMLDIPYTTCSGFVSALTFDKYACKRYLGNADVKFAKDVLIKSGEVFDRSAVEADVQYPVFVKPNAGGSSFGVSKVCSPDELEAAVNAAYSEDCDVIVENFVPGVELSHGIYVTNDRIIEFPVTQIISETEFFDYQAKYEGKSREITPAPISEELSQRIKATTKKLSLRLGCHGLVRIDYIYSGDDLYFLEINTVPGMSEASIVPQQIAYSGFTMSQILDKLVVDSISRNRNIRIKKHER